jgi:hypothetical protein
MAEYAFIAKAGKAAIKGDSFTAVGDELQRRGFDMSRAQQVGPNEIKIPHTDPRRAHARLEGHNGHDVETEVPSVEIAGLELTAASVVSGTVEPVGLQTRQCGVVHPDGAPCMIPVLYEPRPCGCGDYVYEHDGPHEAVTVDGVKYRWDVVLLVQDLKWNAYGPMEEEEP